MNTSHTQTYSFIRESQLNEFYPNQINTFWQKGKFSSFTGVNDRRINYAEFNFDNNSAPRPCIVIVPGRSEGYLKYKELVFELDQQGYNSFIIDHRGQGISERLLSNKYKGYVESFDHYSTDLQHFIDTIVTPNCDAKPFLLAHSMGGLIATRYMQKNPSNIQAAVLSSPMFAINSGGLPKWLAEILVHGLAFINQLFSSEPWYFFSQGDVKVNSYSIDNFASNPLMQSQVRYEEFVSTYASTPEIQLGGVTVHWLVQALKTEVIAFEQLNTLITPTLVLQAADDTVVDNDTQDKFCAQLNQLHPQSCPTGQAVKVDYAKHELFFEKDEYRDQALTATLRWFEQF